MPYVAAAAVVAGTAVKVYSDINQANTDKETADYNAKLAKENYNLALEASAINQQRFKLQSQKYIGSQRAAIGAAGVTTEGSPLDVLRESEENAKLDLAMIRYNGELRARGFGNEAYLQDFRGRAAKTQGYLSAGGDLLSGAGSAATALSKAQSSEESE